MEGAVRIVDSEACHIDYRLNLLGVRVRDKDCQLIARGNGSWEPMGPKWELPVHIPADEATLRAASTDTLRLTAWQYDQEHPNSDLRPVLSLEKDFKQALAIAAPV